MYNFIHNIIIQSYDLYNYLLCNTLTSCLHLSVVYNHFPEVCACVASSLPILLACQALLPWLDTNCTTHFHRRSNNSRNTNHTTFALLQETYFLYRSINCQDKCSSLQPNSRTNIFPIYWLNPSPPVVCQRDPVSSNYGK